MRNYQLRKANNEFTLKKKNFLANNKWGESGVGCGGRGALYIWIYAFVPLGFGVTLLIFHYFLLYLF